MDDKSTGYWLELIYASLSGNIEEDKAKELNDWRLESTKHQAFFDEAILFFDMIDFGISPDDDHIETAYQEFLQKQKKQPRHRWQKQLWPYVAVAAGLILAFFGGLYISKHGGPLVAGAETVITVDKGSKSKTVLPDGTEVWLNSDTKLEIDRNFGSKDRRIKIEGEAFFHVAHDQQKPFIIKTSSLDVKVHGTSFNLSCYHGEDTRIALVEGSVELISGRGESVFLKPNDIVIYGQEGDTFKRSKDILQEEYGWRESKFVFKDRRFAHIVTQLERMFNVEIHVTDQRILNKRFSGDFVNNESISDMMDIMAKVGEFSYQIKGREIQVY